MVPVIHWPPEVKALSGIVGGWSCLFLRVAGVLGLITAFAGLLLRFF